MGKFLIGVLTGFALTVLVFILIVVAALRFREKPPHGGRWLYLDPSPQRRNSRAASYRIPDPVPAGTQRGNCGECVGPAAARRRRMRASKPS